LIRLMTREELNSIPVMQKSIDRKLERIEYLRAKSTATPPMTTDGRVQTTVTNKSMIVSDTLVDLDAVDKLEEHPKKPCPCQWCKHRCKDWKNFEKEEKDER
jgi:hypothetical protein